MANIRLGSSPIGVRSDPDAVIRRAAVRIIPFVAFLYCISFLDRVNISFAAIEMNKSLSLSPLEYGAGAGIFFLGYLIFQIPSNLLLQRFGAQKWLAVIILAWGLASLSMSFIGSAKQFYIVRFLLGAAEAGFFPGLVLYLTYWFPTRFRGRVMSGLLISIPVATVIGAPISNFILGSCDGMAGWEAWRWLFLIESVPALLSAVLVWTVLPNSPAVVNWLSASEKCWLTDQLGSPEHAHSSPPTLIRTLLSARVIAYASVYFGLGFGLYGIGLWIPQIIKASGASDSGAILFTAIPYSVAAVAMILWGRLADRNPTTARNCWLPMLVCAVALGSLPLFSSLIGQLLFLSFAAAGVMSALAAFWALPTASMPQDRLPVVVATINTAGSIGGFVGPYGVGWLKEITGHFGAGIGLLASGVFLAALLLMSTARTRAQAAD